MDDKLLALILGLAGLMATLITSGIGFYFTAKARTAPFRELLYSKQIELALEVVRAFGRAKLYAAILSDPDSPHHDRALEDLRDKVVELSRLTDSAAAILPTELYIEVQRLSSVVSDFLGACEDGTDLTPFAALFAGHGAKTALLARTYLGVDELSEQSAALFAGKDSLEKVSRLDPMTIAQAARAATPKLGPDRA